MKREHPSPQCCSDDSLQRASPPVGKRTCGLIASPKPPHAECTMMGPNLHTHKSHSLFTFF